MGSPELRLALARGLDLTIPGALWSHRNAPPPQATRVWYSPGALWYANTTPVLCCASLGGTAL